LASRGFTYLKLGRPKEAIADYDAEIKINPGNPYSLFGRGIGKQLTGDTAGAEADMAAAIKINASIAERMAKLGVRFDPS
jgi:tetratricopeptide (TPR) repeat protein